MPPPVIRERRSGVTGAEEHGVTGAKKFEIGKKVWRNHEKKRFSKRTGKNA